MQSNIKLYFGGDSRRKVFPIGQGNKQTVSKTLMDINQAQRVYGTEGLAITQKALGGGQGAKTGLYAVRQPLRFLNRNQKNIEGDYSFTKTKDRHTPRTEVEQNSRIRRLTPTECCRLQGFPDNWVDGISDTQKYKCLGNAVTTNVITNIIKQLL